jgi:hypothetical protein
LERAANGRGRVHRKLMKEWKMEEEIGHKMSGSFWRIWPSRTKKRKARKIDRPKDGLKANQKIPKN